jgi:hypothetical protein
MLLSIGWLDNGVLCRMTRDCCDHPEVPLTSAAVCVCACQHPVTQQDNKIVIDMGWDDDPVPIPFCEYSVSAGWTFQVFVPPKTQA